MAIAVLASHLFSTRRAVHSVKYRAFLLNPSISRGRAHHARMKTAVHAAPPGSRSQSRSSHSAGFTLLEILITLVIAGLLVSLAALTISRNPRTELVEVGQRLALLFESAADEAQIRAQPIAWQPVSGGYRFWIREAGGWKPLRDELYAPRAWPTPVHRVIIETPDASQRWAERVIFSAESIAPPVKVTLCQGEICVCVTRHGAGRYRVQS